MKLQALLEPAFHTGLAKLVNAGLPMRISYKLDGIDSAVKSELKKFEAIRIAALKKYGQLKEDGSFVEDEQRSVLFKSEEDAASFAKEYSELLAMEVEMEKIKLSDIIEKVDNISVEEVRKLKDSILEV